MQNRLTNMVWALVASIALLTGCGNESGETGGATAPSTPAEPTAPDDTQRVAVTVNESGYEPSEIQAEAGEPLTLVFTRTTDQGCGNELVIASANIERDLPLNQPVEVTFTPDATGELRFTCGMDMYDGKIVVR